MIKKRFRLLRQFFNAVVNCRYTPMHNQPNVGTKTPRGQDSHPDRIMYYCEVCLKPDSAGSMYMQNLAVGAADPELIVAHLDIVEIELRQRAVALP